MNDDERDFAEEAYNRNLLHEEDDEALLVEGWKMQQDEAWSRAVSQAMTSLAVGALDFEAGSAASNGYGQSDEWLFTNAVCVVGGLMVVGHFVDIANRNDLWGTRSVKSLQERLEAVPR